MRKKLTLAMFILNIFIVGSAYSESEDIKVNYITPVVASNKFKKNAWLVDAMPEVDYAKSHAVGAINLPNDGPDDIKKILVMDLPFTKNDEIIVYCN
ncbi:rhodanese-like domain-containing protein [Geobacter grbiciae]|uniref:rhodanese-like domain-containing protein n=1 Tax=Geobacter grbiciae TaxID=155042 RepID=UPI001C0335DA|nr:rhodanese-like domain-containing protein [Geobacter grbiciae]MBT1074663.1 rhodanese-like domain-containing protein [Geobacter grbiciae]